jgi:hypothetical protein
MVISGSSLTNRNETTSANRLPSLFSSVSRPDRIFFVCLSILLMYCMFRGNTPLDREHPMAKSMTGFWSRSLLMIVLIAAANRPAAGSIVTANFSGSGSGGYSGMSFVGAFDYDQSLTSTNGVFNFQNTGFNHGVVYRIGTGTVQSAQNSQCDPFTITTTSGAFTLLAVDPKGPPATNVTIVVPSSGLSLTHLPGCSIFPTTAPANSTFTLRVNGAITFSGTISSFTSCTGPTTPLPAPTAPAPCYVYTYTYTYPAPCPVYACPPRQGCFLTRLFARRCHRSSCW